MNKIEFLFIFIICGISFSIGTKYKDYGFEVYYLCMLWYTVCLTTKLKRMKETETIRNHMAMQSRKCCTFELRCKNQWKSRNSNTSMAKKTFYWNFVQKIFKIISRSRQTDLIAAHHRILYVLEYSYCVSHPLGRYKNPRFQNNREYHAALLSSLLTALGRNFGHFL